jgi:hypothetical protein
VDQGVNWLRLLPEPHQRIIPSTTDPPEGETLERQISITIKKQIKAYKSEKFYFYEKWICDIRSKN